MGPSYPNISYHWYTARNSPSPLFRAFFCQSVHYLMVSLLLFNPLKRVNCPVIFTTAYDQFLLKAFQGNGMAYLLRPL